MENWKKLFTELQYIWYLENYNSNNILERAWTFISYRTDSWGRTTDTGKQLQGQTKGQNTINNITHHARDIDPGQILSPFYTIQFSFSDYSMIFVSEYLESGCRYGNYTQIIGIWNATLPRLCFLMKSS